MFRFLMVATGLALALPVAADFVCLRGLMVDSPSFLYETTWVVTLFTSIIFIYLYRSDKPAYFVRLYLLSMVVKLLAFLAYNLIMVIKDRPGAAANVLYFLLIYFVFTGLEIGFLYRRISGQTRS